MKRMMEGLEAAYRAHCEHSRPVYTGEERETIPGDTEQDAVPGPVSGYPVRASAPPEQAERPGPG